MFNECTIYRSIAGTSSPMHARVSAESPTLKKVPRHLGVQHCHASKGHIVEKKDIRGRIKPLMQLENVVGYSLWKACLFRMNLF